MEALDLVVLALYLAILVATGVILSFRRRGDTEAYFLADRRMPWWAVAVSVLATSLSAATFLGVPEIAYRGDLRYMSTQIGGWIAAILIVGIFIPAFYRMRVTTIYEALQHRFGGGTRLTSSLMFMSGRLLASGSRLYMASIPLAMILFPDRADALAPTIGAIAVLTLVGIFYTLFGGIAAVIWSDVLQTGVFVLAALGAIVLLLNEIPAPTADVVEAIQEAGKFTVLEPGFDTREPWLGFDPGDAFALPAILIGFTLLALGSYGTDQDLMQRMLTCKSAARGGLSLIGSLLLTIPIVALFMTVGLLLWVFYDRPDLMQDVEVAQVVSTERVFPQFIINQMPAGLRGLLLAGIFAAGLSSLNSAINAMASAFVTDVWSKIRPEASATSLVRTGRAAVLVWGVLLGSFAALCAVWQRGSGQTLIDFALSVMNFAYAGLIGVFCTAFLTKRGNATSGLAALAVGVVAVFVLRFQATWTSWLPEGDWLVEHVVISYPWQLVISSSLAFLTCFLGTPHVEIAVPKSLLRSQRP